MSAGRLNSLLNAAPPSGPSVMISSAVTMRSGLPKSSSRLFKTGYTQVGDEGAHQTRLRFRPASGGAFIANFTAGTGRRARPRRNRRRVVMGFDLHQNMRVFLVEVVAAGFVVGENSDPRLNLPLPRRCLYKQTARSLGFSEGVF